MNYSPRDKERIQKYRHLFAYLARAFFGDAGIVVMDNFLVHYFANFVVETSDITEGTSLPKEFVREELYNLQRSRLIRSLWAN